MFAKDEATNRLVKPQKPGIVLQPQTHAALQQGIDVLANAIKPTLGPIPRFVASEEPGRLKRPEILDSGALIARRIVELPNADADMGAMLMRQMLWRLYEHAGDGTASAAVIFQTLIHEGLRHIAAGVNPHLLRDHLLQGLRLVVDHIQAASQPLEGRDSMRRFIGGVTNDAQLAEILAEVFDVLGLFGQVHLREGYGYEHQHEYIEGVMWANGVHAANMLLDTGNQRTALDYAAVLITDFQFDDPNELVPIVQQVAPHYNALVLTAESLSERCTNLISHINTQPKPFKLIAVKLPLDTAERYAMFEDLEATVGGRALRSITGDSPDSVSLACFGKAERVWANKAYFCVEIPVEAQTEQRSSHIKRLQAQYERASAENRERLRTRLGRLMGAAAVIYLGGHTEAEMRDFKETVKRYITVLRGALEAGVVTGGGGALLDAKAALPQANGEASEACQAAYAMLRTALESPTRTLLQNVGYDSGMFIANMNGGSLIIDENGIPVIKPDSGVFDAAGVVKDMVDSAVRTAALTLTIDVLVHHRKPEFSATP